MIEDMGKSFMKTIIVFLALAAVLSAPAASALDVVYSLEFAYVKGEIGLIEINLVEGEAPGRQLEPKDGYAARVVSDKGDLLYSINFSIPLEVVVPHGHGGENTTEAGQDAGSIEPGADTIILDSSAFSLVIPYFQNAKLVNIYSPEGELKLSVDISRYTETAKSAGAETAEAPDAPLPIVPVVVGLSVVGIVAVGLLVRRRRGRRG